MMTKTMFECILDIDGTISIKVYAEDEDDAIEQVLSSQEVELLKQTSDAAINIDIVECISLGIEESE